MASSIQPPATFDVESDLVLLLDHQGICHEYLTQGALLSPNPSDRSPREQVIGQALDLFLPAALADRLHHILPTLDQSGNAFDYADSTFGRTSGSSSPDTSQQYNYAVRLTHCGEDRILCVIRRMQPVQQLETRNNGSGPIDLLHLYSTILENIPHGIVLADATNTDYPILYVNPGFEVLTGYSIEECLGKNCRFLQGPASDPTTIEHIRRALHAGQPILTEILNYRKDGTPFWNALSIVPIRSEVNDITWFIGIQIDTTGLKQLELQIQQEQKLDAVARLAGGIAHDFNNILTVIANYSELVLSLLPHSTPLYSKVQQIQKAGERASHLTQHLLTFSRRQQSNLEVVNLNQVLQNFEPILRRLVGESITWITVLGTELHPIEADLGQLEQVLTNLVMNAYEAMPNGGLLSIQTENVNLQRPELPVEAELKEGPYVHLSVGDSGHGIGKEIKNLLFEPFFTTKEVGQGTGLGLATVHGIVNQHSGFIDVESIEGAGATFHIYFPRSEQPLPVSRSLSPLTDLEQPLPVTVSSERQKKTILIVDDEQPILSLMAMILEEGGYIVLQATSGMEAIDIATQEDQAIDLLLSDMVMPGMNGHELYDILVQHRPNLRVLFVSGYTEVRVLPDGKSSARIGFLGKPFTWQQLMQKVQEMLDN